MYIHPKTQEAVYSVTTVLDRGIPKPGLIPWAAKEAARYAVDNFRYLINEDEEEAFRLISTAHERAKEAAAEKGDEAHTSAENLVKGKPDGKALDHMGQLEDFLKVSGYEVTHTEVTLWNRRVGYAGTADCIVKTPQGNYLILDYKTGKNVWPEAMLQLTALAHCEFILTDKGEEIPLPLIYGVGILHLRPRSWWLHLCIDGSTAERNWTAFRGAKAVSDWRRYHPAMVFGPIDRMNSANWAEAA
jgi:hypothetical protein